MFHTDRSEDRRPDESAPRVSKGQHENDNYTLGEGIRHTHKTHTDSDKGDSVEVLNLNVADLLDLHRAESGESRDQNDEEVGRLEEQADQSEQRKENDVVGLRKRRKKAERRREKKELERSEKRKKRRGEKKIPRSIQRS